MEIVIGIILIIASVFLIAAVLMQEGKGRGLSGAISGGSSDTFLGKSGSASMQKSTTIPSGKQYTDGICQRSSPQAKVLFTTISSPASPSFDQKPPAYDTFQQDAAAEAVSSPGTAS